MLATEIFCIDTVWNCEFPGVPWLSFV